MYLAYNTVFKVINFVLSLMEKGYVAP